MKTILLPLLATLAGLLRSRAVLHLEILALRQQLHRVLREYVETYFNSARPHQGLFQRIPALAASRSVSEVGRNVVGRPILGGLHHDYQWAAWAPIIRAGAHVDGKGSQHGGLRRRRSSTSPRSVPVAAGAGAPARGR